MTQSAMRTKLWEKMNTFFKKKISKARYKIKKVSPSTYTRV